MGMTRDRTQRLLMDTLAPLGTIVYGVRLAWHEYCRRSLQRKDAAHPDIPMLVHRCHSTRNILMRRT